MTEKVENWPAQPNDPGEIHVFPGAFADWKNSSFMPSSQDVGTPCNRYVVRQPDGHRDVDDQASGNYAFSAFGLRKKIGGEFQSMVKPGDFYGRDTIAYCPDPEKPYATDLFGVTVPGVFNFELLDYYQQKLSLVGAAHLHMHTPDMKGAAVLSFNDDGSLRYLESRNGGARHHDMAFVDNEKVIVKIGGHFSSRRQPRGRERFGVPLWSFIENTSLWIETNNSMDRQFDFEETADPGVSHLALPQLERFNNRLIARKLILNSHSQGLITLNRDGSVVSASTGESSIAVSWSGKHVVVRLSGEDGSEFTYDVNGRMYERYAEALPKLPLLIDHTTAPHPTDVIAFAKEAYMRGHSLLAGRRIADGKLFI